VSLYDRMVLLDEGKSKAKGKHQWSFDHADFKGSLGGFPSRCLICGTGRSRGGSKTKCPGPRPKVANLTKKGRAKLVESDDLVEYGGIGGRVAGARNPFAIPLANITTRRDMTPDRLEKRKRENEQRAEVRERLRRIAIEGRTPLKTTKESHVAEAILRAVVPDVIATDLTAVQVRVLGAMIPKAWHFVAALVRKDSAARRVLPQLVALGLVDSRSSHVRYKRAGTSIVQQEVRRRPDPKTI